MMRDAIIEITPDMLRQLERSAWLNGFVWGIALCAAIAACWFLLP